MLVGDVDGAGLDVPDLLCILADGTVAGEIAHLRDVDEALLLPFGGFAVELGDLLLDGGVGIEVGRAHVVVGVEAFEDRLEDVEFAGREEVGADELERAFQQRGFLHEFVRTVPPLAELFHLVDVHAEDEDVVLADLVSDLDVRAVERADRERAVQGELHVAGAGRLGSGKGNLLGEVGGGNDLFGEGDAVVCEEDDLQLVADGLVVVDDLGDGVDELDDELGHVIAGGGFRAEDDGARDEVHVRVVLQLQVERDGVEDVQELALVLVEALHLHVEEGIGVDFDAVVFADVLREDELVGALGGPSAIRRRSSRR